MCGFWKVSTNQAVQLGNSLLVAALADPLGEKCGAIRSQYPLSLASVREAPTVHN